jgi:hypothetical protein
MEPSEIFSEWDVYAKRKELVPRDIDSQGIINNSDLKIIGLTGIRRSGKSSALMLLAKELTIKKEKVAYVNLEDSRLAGEDEPLDDVIKWFGDEGYLLLDEVTRAKDWEGWLARTHELLKGKLKLIVSSSRGALFAPSRPLRGRILPIEMYPLAFKEYLEFKEIEPGKTTAARGKIEAAFSEYQKYGGFPEIAFVKNDLDKIRILNSYFRDIIGLDIAEASGSDISLVEAFGRYLLQSPYFSASKCLNFMSTLGFKIGKEKILLLERSAQESFLFFFVPIFAYNIKDRSQYPRKAYCGDTGFFYAGTGVFDLGRTYENLAYLELRRRTQRMQDICYWKDKAGHEVDFIVRNGRQVSQAIQVVYDLHDEKTKKREIASLVRCAIELKAEKTLILTKDEVGKQTLEGIEVEFIPLLKWLMSR